MKAFLSGLVSAASDNDPTTVGTIAMAGAATMYGLEWLLVLVIPMLAVVQVLGTRVAAVAREGLQAAVLHRYGKLVALVSAVSIVAVSVLTLGADLQAGAASLSLLTRVPAAIWIAPLAVVLAVLLSLGSFNRIRNGLALLPLAFLAYAAAAVMGHPDWGAVARGFVPHLAPGKQTGLAVLAILGTLLTAYCYLWQSVEVAADRPARTALRSTELATLPGIVYTVVVLWFILIASAATLGAHHRGVQTAQEAATALAPFAGRWAPVVFGLGLLGSSLLAVPVIAAATANAVCATFGWNGSLDARPREARAFYATLYVSLALGALLSIARVPTITLLVVASIAGGLATPVTLVLLLLLVRDRAVMRDRRAPRWMVAGGWSVTIAVTLAGIVYLVRS